MLSSRGRVVLLRVLLPCILALAACGTTSTNGPDGGPNLQPASPTAQVVAGVTAAGLAALEPLAERGAAVSAGSGQTVRCYLFSAAAAIAHTGGDFAGRVASTGEWFTAGPDIRIDTAACRPNGLVPRVSAETEATVRKLLDQTLGPVVALTRAVMGVAGVGCRWQAFAEWVEREAAAVTESVVHVLAYPDEPWVLPALPLPACPGEGT
jgi:hypothetical protein